MSTCGEERENVRSLGVPATVTAQCQPVQRSKNGRQASRQQSISGFSGQLPLACREHPPQIQRACSTDRPARALLSPDSGQAQHSPNSGFESATNTRSTRHEKVTEFGCSIIFSVAARRLFRSSPVIDVCFLAFLCVLYFFLLLFVFTVAIFYRSTPASKAHGAHPPHYPVHISHGINCVRIQNSEAQVTATLSLASSNSSRISTP